MRHRYGTGAGTSRRLLVASIFGAFALGAPSPAHAQIQDGISLGLSPTAERVSWNDDLALERGWYYGGRASLNFGRFVALEGYYLEGNDLEAPSNVDLGDARRYGGDVVFTMADQGLRPFVRLGAGVSEFEILDGGTSEMLTGNAAAGIRFDLSDRLQTQIYAQDVAFRASGSSPLIASGQVPTDDTETLHNFAFGAGANFYLGGPPRQTQTDRAFEGGPTAVTSPLELYGGEVRWSDGVGLPSLPVAGARLGVDFGPYVGIRGYYFGSVENDLNDFTDFFGYGAEGRFNLTPSDAAVTPFLVVGGGRIHFPDAARAEASFDHGTKWNAVLGGGAGLDLTERLRIEASARDMVLSVRDPESVTAPDQLEHNWVYSAGLRFAISGGSDESTMPEPSDGLNRLGDASQSMSQEDLDSSAVRTGPEDRVVREIRGLRAEVDSLRRALRDSATAAPTPARTVELPVLDQGEIYVRFGESGTFERARARSDADLQTYLMIERMTNLESDLRETPSGPQRDSLRARVRVLEERLEARGVPAETDSDRVGVRAPTEAPVSSPAQGASSDPQQEAEIGELRRIEERLLNRIDRLEREIEEMEAIRSADPVEPRVNDAAQVPPSDPMGVLRGQPMHLRQLSPFMGPGFGEPGQLHLGAKADLGSAFGGPGRFVPQVSFGVTDEFSWSANAHVEWPIVQVGEARPYVGGGLGLRDHGDMELLLPNVVVGARYPLGNYELFGAIQGLDWFDDTRLMIGFEALEGFTR